MDVRMLCRHMATSIYQAKPSAYRNSVKWRAKEQLWNERANACEKNKM